MSMEVDQEEKTAVQEDPWLPCLRPIAKEVHQILPPRAWRALRPEFYISFWQLTLYDIYVPVEQYQVEVNKLKHAVNVMDNDRTSYGSSAQAKRTRERDRLLHTAARLEMEKEHQMANHKNVMERLYREKEHWFRGCRCNDQGFCLLIVWYG